MAFRNLRRFPKAGIINKGFLFQKWDEVVEIYYDTFNRTLAEFGLILRHLGTTYQDFLYEVKRALRGQFLCVAFIIPIGECAYKQGESRGIQSGRFPLGPFYNQSASVSLGRFFRERSKASAGLSEAVAC